MSYDPHQLPPLFHIDVVGASADGAPKPSGNQADFAISLLHQLVLGQERQNKLLEEILKQTNFVHRQRQYELGQWKQANPDLARCCKRAAETLSRVQNEFLQTLTEEVADSGDSLLDGEFMLHEFVDRFGPRLAHLNGVLQVLSQLGHVPETGGSPSR
jgi:hypothetical protein